MVVVSLSIFSVAGAGAGFVELGFEGLGSVGTGSNLCCFDGGDDEDGVNVVSNNGVEDDNDLVMDDSR